MNGKFQQKGNDFYHFLLSLSREVGISRRESWFTEPGSMKFFVKRYFYFRENSIFPPKPLILRRKLRYHEIVRKESIKTSFNVRLKLEAPEGIIILIGCVLRLLALIFSELKKNRYSQHLFIRSPGTYSRESSSIDVNSAGQVK